MTRVILLLLLLIPAQEGIDDVRKYVTGESARKPDLEDKGWKEVWEGLKSWKYPDVDVKGEEQERTVTLANDHDATFYYYVPQAYDPAEPSPLIFFLHGGVSSPQAKRGRGQWRVWRDLADEKGWLVCSPSGTNKSLWWAPPGEQQILEAIRFLSREYNVDRNRVVVSGFSDGASGAYCFGMRLTDNWAACIPWNGAVGVVTNPRAGNTPFYTTNCKGTSWRATHGGRDQLYPSASQKPVIDRFKEAGVDMKWKDFEDVGHDGGRIIRGDRDFMNGWLPKRKRNPLPDTVDWTTHNAELYGQAFWIRVNKLGKRPGNPFKGEKDMTFAVGVAGPPRPMLGVQLQGMEVSVVVEGSGAEEAGVKAGDVIVGAGGEDVEDMDGLRRQLMKLKNGDKIELVVERDGKEVELNVTYRPAVPKAKQDLPDAGRVRASRDGNTVKVEASGVASFDILVSPRMFDLEESIVVKVNGVRLFADKVKPDTAFMVDEFRRRLGDLSVAYVGKITIEVPKERQDY